MGVAQSVLQVLYSDLFGMSNFLNVLKTKPEYCFRVFFGDWDKVFEACVGSQCRPGFLELVKVVSQGTLPGLGENNAFKTAH